ncbi:MAG: hypothetical protein QXX41_00070 [Nitrososphaerota archaeon]
MSSLKEAFERIRKRVEELTTDVHETLESAHSLVRSARPKPFRALVERRLENIRPLRRLKERGKTESS